ncbi:MAG: hypothetical protein CSYNP_03124 [Syntrophus sp. SKADARSKE-3]|nr:hypothetical protein [Syntrophus sp. SKADARSKE-3]
MTGEQINDLFMDKVDGDEFSSEEAALRSMNEKYRKLLGKKDWKFLKKTVTLPAGTTSLAGITDLDKVLKVRVQTGQASTDVIELEKAEWEDRFNTDKDYYIDIVNNTVNFIGDGNSYAQYPLIIDYKYKPVDLIMETAPVFNSDFHPILAYAMAKDFKTADENTDFYNEMSAKEEEIEEDMDNYYENLDA